MESLGKDHASSDSSLPPSAASEEHAVPGNDESVPNLSFWREESMIFVTSVSKKGTNN